MGDWEIKNSVENSTVELEQSEKYYYELEDKKLPEKKIIFGSINM
jgi:hypothetical protein